MPNIETAAGARHEEANHLYWHSDRTVDEIVTDLGIPRSTLYTEIHAISAGTSCPQCGNRMLFTNRSNRSANRAVCGVCGTQALKPASTELEVPIEEAPDVWQSPERNRAQEDEVTDRLSRWREDLAAVAPQRAAMVGGAAAAGVLVGAAAARAVRGML